MTWLEWIGIVAIALYLYERYKKLKSGSCSEDPEFNRRKYEFDRMSEAFGRLYDIRDQKLDPHNENINNVQSALDIVILCTVPLPKDSFALDYRSKYIDYCALYILSSAIIEAEDNGVSVQVQKLVVERANNIGGR